MAAWCAAAGRPYNEDNFQLKDNLSNPDWGVIDTDHVVSLDEKGALLVVCDGMGGMNAGEVASDLAVKAIKEQFAPERLTPKVLDSPKKIMRYIENAIIAADEKIKEDGKQNREHEGMGSTIVLAWIVENNIYVGWCGDSRAYRFNPAFGLEQLSHDHSYVQELVDSGKLLPELAFDHPESNIITRSLGDIRQKACPDVACFPLYNDDIFLLCSDGLSGVLRHEEMEAIIAQNTDTMENCRTALWNESEKAGWTDNVTIALCQIVSGAEPTPRDNTENESASHKKQKKTIAMLKFVVAILVVIILGLAGYALFNELAKNDSIDDPTENHECQPDDNEDENEVNRDEKKNYSEQQGTKDITGKKVQERIYTEQAPTGNTKDTQTKKEVDEDSTKIVIPEEMINQSSDTAAVQKISNQSNLKEELDEKEKQ